MHACRRDTFAPDQPQARYASKARDLRRDRDRCKKLDRTQNHPARPVARSDRAHVPRVMAPVRVHWRALSVRHRARQAGASDLSRDRPVSCHRLDFPVPHSTTSPLSRITAAEALGYSTGRRTRTCFPVVRSSRAIASRPSSGVLSHPPTTARPARCTANCTKSRSATTDQDTSLLAPGGHTVAPNAVHSVTSAEPLGANEQNTVIPVPS